jgi:hypothetical protein
MKLSMPCYLAGIGKCKNVHQLSLSCTWYAAHFETWTCLLCQAVGVYLVYLRRIASEPSNGQDVTTNLRSISFIWSMIHSLISCIKRMKRTNKYTWFMYVMLLHSGHRHVIGHSCGHLHGGENKNTNIVMCRNRFTVLKMKHFFKLWSNFDTYNYICILVHTTLKMVAWMKETCRWPLCSTITYINLSACVGSF